MGKLIVFEGIDGSGKKTQLDLLLQILKKENISFKTMDFPRYDSYYGKIIGEYLNGKFGDVNKVDPYFIAITYAFDRLEVKDKIKAWLKDNIVICNRYVDSNKAHQGAKITDKKQRKRFIEWIDRLEYGINKLPRPDITIFLHISSKIVQSLIVKKRKREYIKEKKDIHERNIQHLKKSEEAYLEMSKSKNWKKIECMKNNKLLSKQEIHEKVWSALKKSI